MSSQDRCDRCSAKAVHRFTHKSDLGIDLVFCDHHTTAFLRELHKQGFISVKTTEELVSA